MDLIYIILSIYLRLFHTALPLSRVSSGQPQDRRKSSRALAMWIPIVGWVSVTVHYFPDALWLAWRVTSVERLIGGPPSRPGNNRVGPKRAREIDPDPDPDRLPDDH